MKHKASLLAAIFLLAVVSSFCARAESASLLPRKKQKPGFYLKLHHYTTTPYIFSDALGDLRNGSCAFISRATIGFAYRIPAYRSFYVQPELHYSLLTNWAEAADARRNFFTRVAYAFDHRSGSLFDIPVYLGLRWRPLSLFAARIYAGPLVQIAYANDSFSLQGQYSLVGGLGVDLLEFLSLDAGYRIGMDGLTFLDQTGLYFLAASLKL